MAHSEKPKLDLATLRRLPRGVWALGFVSLWMDVSSEMIHALLPVYLVGVLGASALTVGIIEGIAEATASITKIFSGALSDRIGNRKKLAVLGYGLAAVTKPVFAMAPNVGWFFAARFTDRIGKGIRGAPRDALIADLSPAEMRGASFGLRQSLDTVGAVIGPLLAVLLMWVTVNNFRVVFWIATIPAIIAVSLLVSGVREPERPRDLRKVKAPLSLTELKKLGHPFWWVVIVATVFSLARFSEAFLILKANAQGVGPTFVPFVIVLMSLFYTLAAYPAGVLSDNGSRLPTLAAGLVTLIAADLALAFMPGLTGVAVGVSLWGIHMGFTQGIFSSLVADTAPTELRGTAFGMLNLMTGLAVLAASVIAGALWDFTGPQGTFLAGASIALLALICIPLLGRALPHTAENPDADGGSAG